MEISATERAADAVPTAGTGCSRPIDLVHLARYTMGSRDLEREMLELFSGQAPVYFKRLAVADGDKAWREAAHSLKGSARAVGAWRVAELAEAAETLQSERLVGGREAALAGLRAAIAAADAYIVSLFPAD